MLNVFPHPKVSHVQSIRFNISIRSNPSASAKATLDHSRVALVLSRIVAYLGATSFQLPPEFFGLNNWAELSLFPSRNQTAISLLSCWKSRSTFSAAAASVTICPRISPPGNAAVCTFTYASPEVIADNWAAVSVTVPTKLPDVPNAPPLNGWKLISTPAVCSVDAGR